MKGTRSASLGCWDCSQKNGHAATGGIHEPWHCKPDKCPDRAKHADRMYGDRYSERYGSITDGGVSIVQCIDGQEASKKHVQSRCICGLLLIWTPRKAHLATRVDVQP